MLDILPPDEWLCTYFDKGSKRGSDTYNAALIQRRRLLVSLLDKFLNGIDGQVSRILKKYTRAESPKNVYYLELSYLEVIITITEKVWRAKEASKRESRYGQGKKGDTRTFQKIPMKGQVEKSQKQSQLKIIANNN